MKEQKCTDADRQIDIVNDNKILILYYNSKIWHLPCLKNPLNTKLMSASARALNTCIDGSRAVCCVGLNPRGPK